MTSLAVVRFVWTALGLALVTCAGRGWAGDAEARSDPALPVDPAKTPCVWLDVRPAADKGQVPDGMPTAFAELAAHDADQVVFSGNMIVLRKAGYAHHTATFRFKLPEGVEAGTYEVWTHFALGGVADQDFTVGVGAGLDKLERRAAFRQSNDVSWQHAWRKGTTKLELRPNERWVEITVTGMATQQRQFTAFLLAAETEASRLRDAVATMRSPEAGRRFCVLEGSNPDDVLPVLRYFAARQEALTNAVDVQLLRGQEALDMASCAGAKVPALVATTRGLPRATLALPAAREVAERFIETPQGPAAIILGYGVKGVASPAAEDGQPVFYGALTSNDADHVQSSAHEINLVKKGYAHTTATLLYELTRKIEPGQYDVWTFFTLGGVSRQGFLFRAGTATNALQVRTSFEQSNVASWQRQWQKGAPLTLYPQDRFVEITMEGMQSGQKIIGDFVLVQRAPLPEGVTVETGLRRATVGTFAAPSPKWRIWVLEGDRAADSESFYATLAQSPESVRATFAVTVLLGAQAAELARDMGIGRRPALVWMDECYAVRGVLTAPALETRVKEFLASVTAGGPAPGPFPERPLVAADAPQPLVNGVPTAWLTVSGWPGPAGLSLYGLEAEARTRPNPGTPCSVSQFDAGVLTNWSATVASGSGLVVIEPKSGNYTWARGSAYAHVYLDVEKEADCVLRLAHTGIAVQGWLDGRPMTFAPDAAPPAEFAQIQNFQPHGGETVVGVTDQGGKIEVRLGQSVAPQKAPLKFAAGRHRLLLKLVTQQPAGQTLAFAARFEGTDGKSPAGVRTRLNDPDSALELQATARLLNSLATVNAPGNLPHQGQPLKLRYDLRHLDGTKVPILPFDARLSLSITDYDGKEILRREVTMQFPGVVEFDLGKAPERGYYAVHPTLYAPDGRLILDAVPEGFSVIGGTAAQFARRERKKMAVTYYFMGSGEGATYKTAFPWMTRMGIYRNIGSNPEFPVELAEVAKAEGIILTMDFWDIHNAYSQAFRDELAKRAAPYTRWYKSYNEVDINKVVRGTPEHWVARTKGEYEAAKAGRPDAFYVGGSLVYPGVGDWFTECLRLGLDQYVDAWDVHCYPQNSPVLEGSMSNSSNETDLGVLTCYQRIGRTNTKPFWIGETGARAAHGYDARRWQADTVTKMTACVGSRKDCHYIGFLWPWQPVHSGTQAGPGGGANDITPPHMPGEAAYYTVSALIDGFDYQRLDFGPDIQAARFGETTLLWSTGQARQVAVPLDGEGPWVLVDVVGRVRDLPANTDGRASVLADGSPRYILRRVVYDRLTAD